MGVERSNHATNPPQLGGNLLADARDALFHAVFTPGTKPTAIYLTAMPWALTAREADALLESCSHWAGEAFGCGAYSPAKHGQTGTKADFGTRLNTLLAMASISTNARFKRALPDTAQWLKVLTIAVGGYLPASAITHVIQGFKTLYSNGKADFNAGLLWSTARILAVGAGPPNKEMVSIIAGVLAEHFDSANPVHGNADPTRCLWGLVQALAYQIKGKPLPHDDIETESRCNRCADTATELRPFEITAHAGRRPCQWCNERKHDITTCPIIRAHLPKACQIGSHKIMRRLYKCFSTNTLWASV